MKFCVLSACHKVTIVWVFDLPLAGDKSCSACSVIQEPWPERYKSFDAIISPSFYIKLDKLRWCELILSLKISNALCFLYKLYFAFFF